MLGLYVPHLDILSVMSQVCCLKPLTIPESFAPSTQVLLRGSR